MSDKIARLGIKRNNELMYYVKDGDVWATPLRRNDGSPKGRPKKIASTGLALDYSRYLYFLDSDGDVSRKERALGGKAKTPPTVKGAENPKKRTTVRSAITGHYVKEATAKRHPKTTVTSTVEIYPEKTPEQLDSEIEECLMQPIKKDRR